MVPRIGKEQGVKVIVTKEKEDRLAAARNFQAT